MRYAQHAGTMNQALADLADLADLANRGENGTEARFAGYRAILLTPPPPPPCALGYGQARERWK